MNTVASLEERRNRRKRPPPTRSPDFVVSGWLENGEVDWAHYDFGLDMPHAERIGALVDAAWIDAMAAPERSERPAFWWRLSNNGSHVMLTARDVADGTNWRHACWMVRQWWRMTKQLAVVTWRMWRGKG